MLKTNCGISGGGHMTKKNQNVQDLYLNALRKGKTPVVIYLTNGARLKGTIKSFDNFVVVIKQDKQQLIYKHAISTIIPEKDVNLNAEAPEGESTVAG